MSNMESKSNNWRKLHGYPMYRFGGVRKRETETDKIRLPFPESRKKDRARIK